LPHMPRGPTASRLLPAPEPQLNPAIPPTHLFANPSLTPLLFALPALPHSVLNGKHLSREGSTSSAHDAAAELGLTRDYVNNEKEPGAAATRLSQAGLGGAMTCTSAPTALLSCYGEAPQWNAEPVLIRLG
jgi:hypothetical protein